MKKTLSVVLCFTILLAGCGGHSANPVDRYMPGDERKSCNALHAEMSQLDSEIAIKRNEKDKRDTMNIICFVTGLFIIVPFFFMDVKGSYEVEIQAVQARKKALLIIFNEKNCDLVTGAAIETNTEGKQLKIEGYQTKTDTKTGKVITYPVYEDEQK